MLLGEFGEERRALVKISDVPEVMKQAILAAEDDRFYEHGGIDYTGVIRAAFSNFTSGSAKQGASTITMQVARNFFLTKEKNLDPQVQRGIAHLENRTQLEQRRDFAAIYQPDLSGSAGIWLCLRSSGLLWQTPGSGHNCRGSNARGLPKAPSSYNPVVNPKRAKLRQLYVLRRMHELNYINDEQYDLAQQQPIVTVRGNQEFAIKADYLAEMVRQAVYEKYQDDTYTQGFKVYTTIRQKDQLAAYEAVRTGVLDYDRRQGYRGPEGFVDLHGDTSNTELMDDALQDVEDSDDLIPAVVLAASPKLVQAYCKGGEIVEISGDALLFAQPALNKKVALNQRINVGSLIRFRKDDKGIWQISQLPQVEAAFVSGNPRDGAIYSLVGGFDFNRNQFNHITQAWRQPGSSFKPFVYSAALEKGFTPATVINDAPLVFDAEQTGNEPWEPKNYDGKFEGPMRMRQALIKSKNLVSIRILQSITPEYAHDYITRFGFDPARYPPYLTMALGAGSVTPMQMLTGYSVFANGGYSVTPYFINRIEDAHGTVLYKATPDVAGNGAKQVIDVRNAYTMVSMLQDVVRHGTGIRAMQLGRQDLAGKTGTTNDSIDAWFCGFQPTVVGIAWMGYDQPRSLGDRETGGGAALPIWMSYMGKVLKDVPEASYNMPDNMVAVHINNDGYRDDNSPLVEYFYQENVPPEHTVPTPSEEMKPAETVKDQLL